MTDAGAPRGRQDLLEIMDDRAERHAIVITAQLPIEHWHGWIGDAIWSSTTGRCSPSNSIADAILDRLFHHAHRLTLKVESLRRAIKEPETRSDKSPNVTD